MAKFLIANFPVTGHVNPCICIADELVRRGHEVWWYTGNRFKEKIESTGASFIPMSSHANFNEEEPEKTFPERVKLKGIRGLKYDFKHIFIDSAISQRKDLINILYDYPADVILSEPLFLGPMLLPPGLLPARAGIGIFPLGVTSKDTAPFGMCIAPSSSLIGQIRNHFLNYLAKFIFNDVQSYANEVRKDFNLPPMQDFFMDEAVNTLDIYLQGTTPLFEYPRSDLPSHVHFIGPLLPIPDDNYKEPSWWSELQTGKPVIFVTQGTIATDHNNLLMPTFEALKEDEFLVIATMGKKICNIDKSSLPDNVRLESYIPYDKILPFVDVMITNAGYGGVQLALKHGVPLVVSGQTEEKGEICSRVTWSKVGISIKPALLKPGTIRSAVVKVLNNKKYKRKAEKIKEEFDQFIAPEKAANLLESLLLKRKVTKCQPQACSVSDSNDPGSL
ncbi:MAG: glycosyltransferase [Gammaproteobacteria bacterium]|nr:MAG: glycosyltransferase [Gammaproteobacteria bacterium]